MLGIVIGVCFIGMGLILFTEYSKEGEKKAATEVATYTQKATMTHVQSY